MAANNGNRGLITFSMDVFATPTPTKSTEPTGGVHSPYRGKYENGRGNVHENAHHQQYYVYDEQQRYLIISNGQKSRADVLRDMLKGKRPRHAHGGRYQKHHNSGSGRGV